VTTPAKSSVAKATLEGFRRGENQAFAELVRTYSHMVRSIVNRYWQGAFHREEAMQEIWAQVFRQREALDPSRFDEFGAWLTAVARNRCIDLLRKEGRSIGPDYDDPVKALDKVPASPLQEHAVESSDLLDAVKSFKAKLRPRWRSFFDLHFVEGLGYREISVRLGISRARCKYLKRVLVRRAQRDVRLLDALGRHMRSGGDHAPG
jgi:RNA polymerase sigma-70 factor (ECF subfamily)